MNAKLKFRMGRRAVNPVEKNSRKREENVLRTSWTVAFFAFLLWLVFTPYLAIDQARQLAACCVGLGSLAVITVLERGRKQVEAWQSQDDESMQAA